MTLYDWYKRMNATSRSTDFTWPQALWLATLWVGAVLLPTLSLGVMLVNSVIQLSVHHDSAVMADLVIVRGREDVDTWQPITIGLPVVLTGLLLVVPLASALAHRSWKVAALSLTLILAALAVMFIIYVVFSLSYTSVLKDAMP